MYKRQAFELDPEEKTSEISFEIRNPEPDIKEDPVSEKKGNLTLFTLEEDWEDENELPLSINEKAPEAEKPQFTEEKPVKNVETVVAEKKEEEIKSFKTEQTKAELKTIREDDPFDEPISATISRQIQDRRDRLKKFNFKFKSRLGENEIDEAEKIPAYKRNNIELSEHKREKPGGYILDKDANNDLKIRPNNFLHDNVD